MPNIVSSILLLNVAWYLWPLLKAILLFLPEHWKKVIYDVNSNTIKKYVSKECLPTFIPTTMRKEPIQPFSPLEDKTLLKDMNDEQLTLAGMKSENMKEYEKILKFWQNLDEKK